MRAQDILLVVNLWRASEAGGRHPVGMQRARSVTGPLRRAHPASGATWNVQVVRGKMSSKCLWHACRALSAGLLLMLLGAAMAVIGYYADTLSVDQEVRGNSTVSVKDEARGFHLNNLSYAGPIVMGFGGFIVVAACVMTFEARDSAAKVTPARPQALPRPLPRRGPPCAAPARLDQLGVYRLPHVLPLAHALPLPPLHTYRHRTNQHKGGACAAVSGLERVRAGSARFGSAPDLRSASARAALPAAALRRPLRRYALSVDEPHHTAVSPSAAESECGSQSSLAMDLHTSGACGGVTLRVRDNTRRRPLARQQRLMDDTTHPTPVGSSCNINNAELETETIYEKELSEEGTSEIAQLRVESEVRARSAPPAPLLSSPSLASPPLHASPPPSPLLLVTPCITPVVTPGSDSSSTLATTPSVASCVTPLVTSVITLDVTQPVVTPDTTPMVTTAVKMDITSPVESITETCVTIEQLHDSPSEEEKMIEDSEPPPPDT